MTKRADSSQEEKSYRRGVILGLTIAEIMLLLLFALLLALAATYSKSSESAKRAEAFEKRFGQAVAALASNDRDRFVRDIEEALKQEVDYLKKLKDAEQRLNDRLLPDDVFAEIKTAKLDLATEEGKKRFLALVKAAHEAEKDLGLNSSDAKEMADACRLGMQVAKTHGRNSDPSAILAGFRDTETRIGHWKNIAKKCGLAGTLPPCYKESPDEPMVYVYDAKVRRDGIVLIDTLPDKYRSRFSSDFKTPPTTGILLTEGQFDEATRQFLEYGTKKDCRFYVTAFDETGAQEKERFKKMLKALESNFYKRQTW